MFFIRWVVMLSLVFVGTLFQGVFAQPALSTIQDTLYRADGSKFEGSVTIEWKSFESADGFTVSRQSLMVPIRAGFLRVRLVPTSHLGSATSYQVRFNSGGKVQFTEHWAIPESAMPLKLTQIRLAGAPSQNPESGGQGPLPLAMVTGLAEALSQRPAKDSAYVPGRLLRSSPTGFLTSVSGNFTDCVRVDGTAIPCGAEPPSSSVVLFSDAETPQGVMNGTNAVFALDHSPAPAGSLMLFRNGLLQRMGIDFQLSASTITFLGGSVPGAGDLLTVYYRYE